jgi:hypothetical protein
MWRRWSCYELWRAEDATTDPEELRKAEEELAEFKKAMNGCDLDSGEANSRTWGT